MPMHCPQCLTEYRDGFIECADCRVSLSSGPPPDSNSNLASGSQPESDVHVHNHDVHLVTVFETGDPFALTLAKASLEDAGIEYVMEGDDQRTTGAFPGAFGIGAIRFGGWSSRIQVAQESEAEARRLLEPLQTPDSDADSAVEPGQES
jgi:Putative prokaryotic signal transducing protein